MKKKVPKRILLVKTGAIGDILMSTPLIRKIREQYPDTQIDFLLEKWSAPVLKYHPDIHHLWILPNNSFDGKKVFILSKTWIQLFFKSYSQIYVLHPNSLIINYFRLIGRPLRSFKSKREMYFPRKIHHTHLFLSLLPWKYPPSLNIQQYIDKKYSLDFHLPANCKLSQSLVDSLSNDSKIIIINPGGGSNPGESVDVRQWGLEKHIRLIQQLDAEFCSSQAPPLILLTGGKGDRHLCNAILEAAKNMSVLVQNLAGETSLYQLKLLIDKAAIFITGDTGGMHIAASTNTPILSIFGPTDPIEKAPLTERSQYIVTEVPCHPCYFGKFRGCNNFICMNNITVERVKKKVLEMIKTL